ncbi:hypothetical protein FRC06_010389, partial [Ceratobasidium sp. 370]
MDLDDGKDLFVPPPDVPPRPGMLRNPLVLINDWPSDDKLEDVAPPKPDIDDTSIGSDGQDPEFIKDDWMQGLDPDAEPDMDEGELWGYLRQQLGDLAKGEWLDIYNRFLTDKDRVMLGFLAAHQCTHFSQAMYEDVWLHACQELGLPSDCVALMRLKTLSGLESHAYDCHIDLKPHHIFNYTPLIPQLVSLFQNPRSIKQMRHCTQHKELRPDEPHVIDDVFDGEIYRTLRNTK